MHGSRDLGLGGDSTSQPGEHQSRPSLVSHGFPLGFILAVVHGQAQVGEALPGEIGRVNLSSRRDRNELVADDLLDWEASLHFGDDAADSLDLGVGIAVLTVVFIDHFNANGILIDGWASSGVLAHTCVPGTIEGRDILDDAAVFADREVGADGVGFTLLEDLRRFHERIDGG